MLSDKMRKRAKVEESVKPGSIVTLWVGRLGKEKHLIIGALNPFCGFYINSKINEGVLKRAWQIDCQVKILKADHPDFLNDDSHADCSKVITEFTRAEVITHLMADGSKLRGVLNSSEITAVKAAANKALDIAKIYKDVINATLN